VSVILIIGTIIVYQQIKHVQNRPIGYDRNNLIGMSLDKGLRKHLEAFRADLKTAGLIEEMAASNSPLTNVWTSSDHLDWEGKDPGTAVDFPNSNVTVEWGKTIGWNILKGRDFSKDFASDSSSFVINESLAKFLGFNNPIGKTIKWGDKPYTIIGIVSDIISESPFAPVRPSLYHIGEPNLFTLTLKLNPNKSANKSIAQIENIWKKYVPNSPFTYEFIDQQYGNKFSLEERIGKLAAYFSLLAILISCLGLFGIASFIAEQRTKEIGIRKVVGASVFNLWRLLSKDFIVLVIVSCFIAIPIAYYYMHEWLQKYQYRTNIEWWIFAAAIGGALLITLLTVSFQAIKAAIANPVKSLRTE
jgi:ABC-type antimicrobial peptide transport system permease subunit